MNIFIDIDETICYHDDDDTTKARDYSLAKPFRERIKKANDLYKEGHHIVYWTARGAMTGIDWRELTEKQLQEWGCLYHELRLDKPAYDLFIDDKVMNSKDW
jgi:hypothetical protein